MDDGKLDEIADFWNRIADDWKIQVGDLGDENRRLNSDPVLWDFAGDVSGLMVLDAGCGTGYLSNMLRDRGAHVTGIDISDRMIAIARRQYPEIEFHVDSVSVLSTIADSQFDLVIANYVLMDTPDLMQTMSAFHRILKMGGSAVLIFSHPCFPQGRASESEATGDVRYNWNFSYFEPTKCIDPPWDHFQSEFIWFHRPLSDYWKAFVAAGFQIVDFEEPRVTADRFHLASSPARLEKSKSRPYSAAFKLQKGPMS